MRRPFKASELIVSNIIDIVDTFCQQEKEYADLANTDNTKLLIFFIYILHILHVQAIDRDNSGYIDAGELGKLGQGMNKVTL